MSEFDPQTFLQPRPRPALSVDGLREPVEGRGLVVPGPGGRPVLRRLPIGPADPGYRERIPPPEPDGQPLPPPPGPAPSPPAESAAPPSASACRLVISFGRREGELVVGVERPPDWDIDRSYVVRAASLLEVLPLLVELGLRLKDLTGGEVFSALEEERERARVRVRRAGSAEAAGAS